MTMRALLTKGRYGKRRRTLSLNLEGKKEVVAEVSARLGKAQTVVIAEFRGLKVEDITVLRARARASGVYLRVLKNSLARRAVQGTPFEKLSDQMVGPLAYGISDDPVAAAKVLHAYAKGNDAQLPDDGEGCRQPGHDAQPRAIALDADGHLAGADHQVRPDAERGAGKARPDPRRGARPEGKGSRLILTTH
jgi:ribosomal protein L10